MIFLSLHNWCIRMQECSMQAIQSGTCPGVHEQTLDYGSKRTAHVHSGVFVCPMCTSQFWQIRWPDQQIYYPAMMAKVWHHTWKAWPRHESWLRSEAADSILIDFTCAFVLWIRRCGSVRVGLAQHNLALLKSCASCLCAKNKLSQENCGDGHMVKWQLQDGTGSHSHKPVHRWP